MIQPKEYDVIIVPKSVLVRDPDFLKDPLNKSTMLNTRLDYTPIEITLVSLTEKLIYTLGGNVTTYIGISNPHTAAAEFLKEETNPLEVHFKKETITSKPQIVVVVNSKPTMDSLTVNLRYSMLKAGCSENEFLCLLGHKLVTTLQTR